MPKRPIHWMLALFAAYPRVGLITLCLLLSNGCMLVSPMLFADIIDELAGARALGDLLPQVAVVGGLSVLVCALGVASSVL
ncbi:MAG: hypothetical protein R3Y56_10205, partial [Akkermansia sp.]